MSKCVYKKGGSKKYVLLKTYWDCVPFMGRSVHSDYAMLDEDGNIAISVDYEWDGASGPTIDTDDTMDGALVHDVLYQMIREGRLKMKDRKDADQCIREMCMADGMPKWRANYWYFFLRTFGRSSAIA